jgi:hypothetical protein
LLAYTGHFPEHKYIMYSDNVDPYRLRAGWPWWASASETMMVSARQSPDSVQSVRIDPDVDRLAQEGAQPGVLLGPFEKINTADLPATHCQFPNTVYRKLNTQPPQDTAALRAYIAAHEQVSLALPEGAPQTLRAGRQQTLEVRVSVPAAAQPLHSAYYGEHPTLLRTTFYQSHDWPSDASAVEVPLEVDVWQPWTQTVPVQAPRKLGHYTLEISLISKNYRNWPVRLRLPVDVR